MKLFGLTFRDKQEQTVEAYEAYVVRWFSYEKGMSISYHREQMRIFPRKESAQEFVKALKDAEVLTRTKFHIEMHEETS